MMPGEPVDQTFLGIDALEAWCAEEFIDWSIDLRRPLGPEKEKLRNFCRIGLETASEKNDGVVTVTRIDGDGKKAHVVEFLSKKMYAHYPGETSRFTFLPTGEIKLKMDMLPLTADDFFAALPAIRDGETASM